MPRRAYVVTAASVPTTADVLTVVRVDGESVTVSTGEILIARYEKLRALCEQLCQEQCPIWMRVWIASDGPELIELHRSGELSSEPPTDSAPTSSESF